MHFLACISRDTCSLLKTKSIMFVKNHPLHAFNSMCLSNHKLKQELTKIIPILMTLRWYSPPYWKCTYNSPTRLLSQVNLPFFSHRKKKETHFTFSRPMIGSNLIRKREVSKINLPAEDNFNKRYGNGNCCKCIIYTYYWLFNQNSNTRKGCITSCRSEIP